MYSGSRECLADLPSGQGVDPSGRWQNFNHSIRHDDDDDDDDDGDNDGHGDDKDNSVYELSKLVGSFITASIPKHLLGTQID